MRSLSIAKKYYVYVLRSQKDLGYYIGFTENLQRRLAEHNGGKTRSLKSRLPLKLVYYEEYETKSAAKNRERQIKSYKGGSAFKRLISSPRILRD